VTFDPLAFIAEFRAEALEHVTALDEQLLLLERNPLDPKPVRAMFLAAHSIKGGAAMLGLDEVRELSHALEDVLGVLRDQNRPLDTPITRALFDTVDQLRMLVPQVDGVAHPSAPATLEIVAALSASISDSESLVEMEHDSAMRVLLVEDSPSVRQVETYLLQDAGFAVDPVTAGDEALQRARSQHYALVIAGVETRDLRGPDLARALGASVPVLLTSTDYQAGAPAVPDAWALGPKGKLGQDEFIQHVREMTTRSLRAA
jgi:chemotaxis protein histidine kinase CheA